MKFIGESYSLYAKDIHQIWCRSAKFLWKSRFCPESGSGSGSSYYFRFQYQTYISDIEDTHQILCGSTNSFESYCVHMKSPRPYVHPDRQTDGFFFSLMRLQYFSLHMHTKPSFAHRLQTAKMASSRTSAQNNGPRAQKMAFGCKIIALGWIVF